MVNYKIVQGKITPILPTSNNSNTSKFKIVKVEGDSPYVPLALSPKGQDEYIKENYDVVESNGVVSYKPKTGGSSSSNSTPTTTVPTAPTAPKSIDMDKLKQDLASGKQKLQIADTERNRQIQQQSNTLIERLTKGIGQYNASAKKGNITQPNTLSARLTKGIGQYNASARKGNISAGFQQVGTIVQNVGEEINKMTFPRPPNPLDFIPLTREIGKTRLPEEVASGIFTGAGKTIKGAGDIIESASNKRNWENLFGAGKKSAEYWIDVGKQSKLETQFVPGSVIPILPKITFSKKTKQELGEAGIIGVGAVSSAVSNFAEKPGQTLGELMGSGALLTGASSIGSKFVGFGKAGVQIVKGGKYVKYETLYETNPKNLLQGKYKKGTPTSTIKEFKTGKNPKTLFHSTGTDFIKGSKGKVLAQETIPSTDVYGLYGSTGTANKVYLRISGSSGYNPVPRIPFLSGSQKIDPTTYRLIGTTKPKSLRKVGKFKNIPEGRDVMSKANLSKNIPLTSPANELGIKIENEAILRPGTILSKKGIKGTQDFTFVQGVFVKTPRVRVMPSKPKLSNIKPSKAKIVENVKPSKSISFEESIRISKNPPTIYNPASLFSSKSSKSSVKSSGSKDYSSFFVSKKGSSVKISNSINSGFSPRPSGGSGRRGSSSSITITPSPTPSPRPSGGSGRRGSGSSPPPTTTTTNVSSSTSTPPRRPSITRLPPSRPPIYKTKNFLPYKPSLFKKANSVKYKVKNVLTFNKKWRKKSGERKFKGWF